MKEREGKLEVCLLQTQTSASLPTKSEDRGAKMVVRSRSGMLLVAIVPMLLALLPSVRGVLEVSSNSVALAPGNDVLSSVGSIFSGTSGVTFGDATGFGSVAGSLALLAAALKAPLVALYQISAEVVVMVALILFISYIASLLGIDDFRKRTGLAAEDVEETARSYMNSFINSESLQQLTEKVHDAFENFDMKNFLDSLDTRH
ncbi:hypothetical protein FHG87_010980 [Trinorchestia longiramus]|nr:hypothetical protein FHG87_010980 [Trinorchestia longiramus]